MDVRVGLWRKLSAEELMLLNCGVGEDSWESLGLQGDLTSPAGVQLQRPGDQPEGMSGVSGKWCSLWLQLQGTTCLFQASGSLLYFFKSIRSEVWHFQFPLTQIIVSLLPFKQSSCFRILPELCFTCDYIVTHAYVWAAYHILSLFLIFLNPACP